MKKIFIALILFNLVACTASSLKVENYKDSEYGSPENVKKLVKDFVISIAKNPDSVVIKQISEPKKTILLNTGLSVFVKPFVPAWGVCVTYKATNSYGGYVQNTENYYVKNNKVLYSIGLNYENEIPTISDGFKPCGF